jgi:hypothetical protein
MSMIPDNIQRAAGSRMVSVLPQGGEARSALPMNDVLRGRSCRNLALIATLALSLSACAMHWPWKRRPPPAPQPVHQLTIAADAGVAPTPIMQYWDRNTLLLDLTAAGGQGSATLTPIAALGWPIRLEFRVQPGSFSRLEVVAAQRVIFAVPSQGAPVLLRLAPSAYHADTSQITLRWSAADDSEH